MSILPSPEKEPRPSLLLDVVPPDILHDDVPGVITVMREVEPLLPDAGLSHMVEFNRIYRRLTEEVWSAIRQGDFFDCPEDLIHTMPIFAYYFHKQYLAVGNGQPVDPVWEHLVNDPRARTAEPGTRFVAGMIPHIRSELGPTLDESGVGERYYKDYRKGVGMLIGLVASECAPEYIGGTPILRGAVNRLTTYAIARWREEAWQAGRDLQEAGRNGDLATVNSIRAELDRRSLRSTEKLLSVGNTALRGVNATIRPPLALVA